jgi:hypothetical protein
VTSLHVVEITILGLFQQIAIEWELTNTWELSFVVPADHGNLYASTYFLPSLLLAEVLE